MSKVNTAPPLTPDDVAKWKFVSSQNTRAIPEGLQRQRPTLREPDRRCSTTQEERLHRAYLIWVLSDRRHHQFAWHVHDLRQGWLPHRHGLEEDRWHRRNIEVFQVIAPQGPHQKTTPIDWHPDRGIKWDAVNVAFGETLGYFDHLKLDYAWPQAHVYIYKSGLWCCYERKSATCRWIDTDLIHYYQDTAIDQLWKSDNGRVPFLLDVLYLDESKG